MSCVLLWNSSGNVDRGGLLCPISPFPPTPKGSDEHLAFSSLGGLTPVLEKTARDSPSRMAVTSLRLKSETCIREGLNG
jgi:hypothetical protein